MNFDSIPFNLAHTLEEQGSSFSSSTLACSSCPRRALACVNTGDSTLLEPRSWRIAWGHFFWVLPLFCNSWNINQPFWNNCHHFPTGVSVKQRSVAGHDDTAWHERLPGEWKLIWSCGVSGNNVAQDMCMQFVQMIQVRAMATEINRGKDTGKPAVASF